MTLDHLDPAASFIDGALYGLGVRHLPAPLTAAELDSLEAAERRSNREIARAVLAARDAGQPRYEFRLSSCNVSGSGAVNAARIAWAVAILSVAKE